MVASAFRDANSSFGPHENDNPDLVAHETQVMSQLLLHGACVDKTTDRTQETSLHLAARYARADAAKRLLDAGADANAEDATGRTREFKDKTNWSTNQLFLKPC
jgi:ankyrin repeat protein